MKKIKAITAWVEIDDKGIVVGRLGTKAWRFKKDIIEEGFGKGGIIRVRITPLKS